MTRRWILAGLCLLFLVGILVGMPLVAQDQGTPPASVTVAGTIQSVLGCPGDWQPECTTTGLTYDAEDDVWVGEFSLPAGSYEYKAALNGGWDENYGAGAETGGANILLVLDQDTTVQFYYDHKTHWITDNVSSLILVAMGDFQTALGCSANDQPDCLRAWLQDPDGNGVYNFSTTAIPVGSYNLRVAVNQNPDEIYGARGALNGDPVAFEVTQDGFKTTVGFASGRKFINVKVSDPAVEAAPIVQPTAVPVAVAGMTVTVPGSYNSEIGCDPDLGVDGDWAPDCTLTLMTDPDGDGIYTFVTGAIPAGAYEAKVAIDLAWTENYGADGVSGGANIPFEITVDYAQVTFNFDSASKVVTIAIDPNVIGGPAPVGGAAAAVPIVVPPKDVTQPDLVVIPGTIQTAAGCPGDWQAECASTALTFDEADGVWQGTFDLPAGDYEYKVALNGTWDVNYGGNADAGGANVALKLGADSSVKFYYDAASHWVADSVGDVIAVAPGSFQSELGCSDDWQPDCLRSWLQDPDGDGVYVFTTDAIPAGDYEVKVALNESWDVNYGADAVAGGANIPFNVPADGTPVAFVYNAATNLLLVGTGTMPVMAKAATPDLSKQKAQWVNRDTVAWDVGDVAEGTTFKLFYSAEGGMKGGSTGFSGGQSVDLTLDPAGLSADILAQFPQLEGYAALKLPESAMEVVRGIARSQIGVAAFGADGKAIDGTGLQIPGALDDLFVYDGELGVTFEGDVPTLRVWAPTAQRVRLMLFDDSQPDTKAKMVTMAYDRETGVWSAEGDASWSRKFYLYEVKVYAPSVQEIVTNRVTDPYSLSLSTNSLRSQIVRLEDADLLPEGWSDLAKPPVSAAEDTVIYELHVRDFSMNDASVPEEYRGTFMAFTVPESNGMQHLAGLAQSGLTYLHLLPVFDMATINEVKAEQQNPDPTVLATFPSDSEEQQAAVNAVRDADGFNWGYDPYHYTTPEGSYSTNPDGVTRIVEFRQMVAALNQVGLRVVMDVVYNHTNASGESEKSVLDQIVPGYYHRLNNKGAVETSTCCANTATEHRMMEKLMIDSLVTWAKAYKIDAFRFDLMGHHMRSNMEHVRAALDALTLEKDGVDGKAIYLYGEGWNFGEVKDNARGVNATQLNMGGVGIGTFNDRLRDAVRGGTPFGDRAYQGFANGLSVNPNGLTGGTAEEQAARLLLFSDQIRIGLAGGLRDYSFIGADGNTVTGADVLYSGDQQPTGYTLDPQEQIVYVSKHDNETIWDITVYKQIPGATVAELVRMNNLALNIVMLSQGVPFFHAGDDLLRSKSMDRDSYNSGDWFNKLDFTYQSNNFGVGLPIQDKNGDRWQELQPMLANPALMPTPADIESARMNFREMLQIRQGSPLFRLSTAQDIQDRLTFQNVGPDQIPGLIVMTLEDAGDLTDLDANYTRIVVLFNANTDAVTFTNAELVGQGLALHPVLADSYDAVVRGAAFDASSGTFTIPGRTAAVFVLPQ